eukprot:TCONS_00027656-protein
MVFGIHIKKSPRTPRKEKEDSPTFHFDLEESPQTSNTKQQLNKSKSVNNLQVENDLGHLGFTTSPISRRHSHHIEPRRRLGSSRRRGTVQKKKSENGENDSGSDIEDYNFMDAVRKQRSRSLNTHHDIPSKSQSDAEDGKPTTPRLKIKSVSFVTHSGHEFHVRERST